MELLVNCFQRSIVLKSLLFFKFLQNLQFIFNNLNRCIYRSKYFKSIYRVLNTFLNCFHMLVHHPIHFISFRVLWICLCTALSHLICRFPRFIAGIEFSKHPRGFPWLIWNDHNGGFHRFFFPFKG